MQSDFRKTGKKIGNIQRVNTEKILSIVNDGILAMYAMFITEEFLGVTMFHIQWPEHFHQTLTICALLLLMVKLLCIRICKSNELILMVVFIGVFLMAREVSGYTLLGDILLFILASKGISFRKIVKVYFTTVGFLLIVTIFASQIGMIENLVFYFTDRGKRFAFGVCYPTDFAAFVVWLTLAWIYIRKDKLSFPELFVIFLASLGVWHYCNARLSAILLAISVLIFLSLKLYQIYLVRKKAISEKKRLSRWLQNIIVFTTPFCSFFFIFLSYIYSENYDLLAKLNSLLSGRLLLGHLAFEKYDLRWFGQYILMIGYGKSTLLQLRSPEYFFIDSSFVSILMCYGIMVFICIIFMFTYSAFRAKKVNDYYTVLIIALIAIDCMVEHHMMEFCYNPFLFLLLSSDEHKKRINKEQITMR